MKNQLIAIILFSCLLISMQSKSSTLNFIQYDVRNGLSNNEINAIAQDSDGFIWIGTTDGLDRFDGYEFTHYRNIYNDSSSINHNLISCIFIDSKDRMWVGTQDGISRYKKKTDGFEHFKLENTDTAFSTYHMTEYIDGSILFATNIGLYKYNEMNHTIEAFFNVYFNHEQIEIIHATQVLENGDIIIATEYHGMYYYTEKNEKLSHFQHDENNSRTIGGNKLRFFTKTAQNQIWIGFYGGGIDLFDPQKKTFKHFKNNSIIPNSLADNNVFALTTDNHNNILIGGEKGFNIYDPANNRFYLYKADEFNDKSIAEDKIRSIFQDKQGNIWIGHYNKGLSFSTYNFNRGFSHVYKNVYSKNTLSNNIVAAILEDSDGDLWVGTDGGGLNHYITKQDRWVNYLYDPLDRTAIGSNSILVIFEDTKKNIWIGGYGAGLSLLDKNFGTFVTYKNIPGDTTSIPNNDVRSILQDEQGNLWITTHGKGIAKFNLETKKFTNFSESSTNPKKRISSNWTWPLALETNTLWIGSANGLSLLNIRADTVLGHYMNIKNDTSSLSNNSVQCLEITKNGNIWAGTSKGLNLYDRTNDNFIRYMEKDGLANDYIKMILSNDDGNLWVSTNKGLSKLDLKNKKIRNFDSYDGLQDDIFVPRAGHKTNNGNMYFGGINGFNKFNPSEITDNDYIPNVIFTSFKLFNKEVEIGGKNSPLKDHINSTDEIVLEHQQNVITFEFVALNYIQPEKNEYAYYLEGFEEEWNYVGHERKATYTNLDPGEYVFKVKASNNCGIWNEEGISVKLVIKTTFWRFFALALVISVVIVSIVFFIIKLREKTVNEEKNILETKVQEAVNQIEEKKKEIEDQNKALLEKQEEDEIRNWASEGMAKFGDYLREDSDNLDKFAMKIIFQLASFVGANVGGLFIRNDEDEKNVSFDLKGTVAYNKNKIMAKNINFGEGLVGACAFDKKTIYYTDIPENYVKISSGLGEIPPRSLLIVPCIFNEEIFGIIELASLDEFEKYKISFVEELGEKIASTISIVKNNERMAKLLEQSKEQANELITSEEELRQNLEEMRATQEQSDKHEQELVDEIDNLRKEIIDLRRKIREIAIK